MVAKYEFDRLARESVKAFTAFRAYLDLGAERSLATVATKLGKSKVMMEKWSRKYELVGPGGRPCPVCGRRGAAGHREPGAREGRGVAQGP